MLTAETRLVTYARTSGSTVGATHSSSVFILSLNIDSVNSMSQRKDASTRFVNGLG
jgi:hypothetical protein